MVYGNDSADLSPEFLLYKEGMLFNLLKHKLIFRLSSTMEAELTGRKVLQQNKKLLDDLLKRRFVVFQGFEIYGGCAGLYDFGPVGCAIKTNIEQVWRELFVLEEDILEINTTCVTPHAVLESSGHVLRFSDLMVKDVKTGAGFRADKLLIEWLQSKIEKGKLKPEEIVEYKKHILLADSYSKNEMDEVMKKLKIKSPDTGNELSAPEEFNLMFKTEIGPSTNLVGYLRPETAQGIFVNFHKLLEFNGGRVPFGACQIGLGFRNQIAPRNGLVRVREFQMAEIQYFVDPQDKRHPKFKYVAHHKLPLLSKDLQKKGIDQAEWIQIGEAVKTGLVDNETLGYYLYKIFTYLKEVGLNTEKHLRFRQHLETEMAHYACDCWDAEGELASGWLELVGCADRSAFDLHAHTKGSGVKLQASRKFKEPRPEKQTTITFQRQVIGKQFKKNAQIITNHLENLSEKEKEQLKAEFDNKGEVAVPIEGGKATLTKDHIAFEQKIVNVIEEKFTPNVIEPSFGLGRIMTTVFEHSFKLRDQKRTYLLLKPRIAPVKVSILPLQSDERFVPIIADLKKRFKRSLITCKVDDTGQSIGKRYARTDEIGIPFGVTVDFKTLEEKSVTLRELYTMKQLRVPIDDLEKVLVNLSSELQTWEEICQRYPAYTSNEKEDD